MFCKNCGERIPSNSQFCPRCGNHMRTPYAAENVRPEYVTQAPVERQRRRGGKGPVILVLTVAAVAAVAVAAGIGIVAVRNHKPTTDRNEDRTVSYEEYDSEVTVTTEGVEEVETFDPFEGMEIRYSGDAPNAGVQSYVASVDEISEDVMQQMKAQAEDVLRAEVADTTEFFSELDADEELKAVEYLGDYFLTGKPDMQYGYQNQLYLIYKVQVYNTYNDTKSYDTDQWFEKTTDYYWYCRFTDIKADEDGECTVDLANYTIADYDDAEFEIRLGGNGNLYTTALWEYNGYEELDEMYDNLVTQQLDGYYVEENVTDMDLGGTAASEEVSAL